MKKRVVISSIVVVIISIIGISVYYASKILLAEGHYTGYQLILEVYNGTYREDGENITGETKMKRYNIAENDVFVDPFSGGIWDLNPETTNVIEGDIILKIEKLGEDTVTLLSKDKEYIIQYGEEIKIPRVSSAIIADGPQYSYKIKITK